MFANFPRFEEHTQQQQWFEEHTYSFAFHACSAVLLTGGVEAKALGADEAMFLNCLFALNVIIMSMVISLLFNAFVNASKESAEMSDKLNVASRFVQEHNLSKEWMHRLHHTIKFTQHKRHLAN